MDIAAGRLRSMTGLSCFNCADVRCSGCLKGFGPQPRPSGVEAPRQASNNKLPPAVVDLDDGARQAHYAHFWTTLAPKACEKHACLVSRETLRKWMIEDGSADRKHRLPPVHQPRHRRERIGELVRSTARVILVRESRLRVHADRLYRNARPHPACAFVPSESTFDYMRETRGTSSATAGRSPSIRTSTRFSGQQSGAVRRDGMTQFGRALNELNIDILCANSPQARRAGWKRSFGTLQDRLVKELRLGGYRMSWAPMHSCLGCWRSTMRGSEGASLRRDAHRPASDAHRFRTPLPGRKSER